MCSLIYNLQRVSGDDFFGDQPYFGTEFLAYLDGHNVESHCVQQEAGFEEVQRKTKIM